MSLVKEFTSHYYDKGPDFRMSTEVSKEYEEDLRISTSFKKNRVGKSQYEEEEMSVNLDREHNMFEGIMGLCSGQRLKPG